MRLRPVTGNPPMPVLRARRHLVRGNPLALASQLAPTAVRPPRGVRRWGPARPRPPTRSGRTDLATHAGPEARAGLGATPHRLLQRPGPPAGSSAGLDTPHRRRPALAAARRCVPNRRWADAAAGPWILPNQRWATRAAARRFPPDERRAGLWVA